MVNTWYPVARSKATGQTLHNLSAVEILITFKADIRITAKVAHIEWVSASWAGIVGQSVDFVQSHLRLTMPVAYYYDGVVRQGIVNVIRIVPYFENGIYSACFARRVFPIALVIYL